MKRAIKSYIPFQNLKIQLVREAPIRDCQIGCSEDICKVMHEVAIGLDRECFWMIPLDAKNKVIGINLVSMGSLNAAIVHPREVFKPAILASAAAIILVHNHPSGDPSPSKEDRELTKRLDKAGDILSIKVLDHIVIGDKVHCSMKDERLF